MATSSRQNIRIPECLLVRYSSAKTNLPSISNANFSKEFDQSISSGLHSGAVRKVFSVDEMTPPVDLEYKLY